MKVIVVGAGHNGLICASLLAEKGFDVLVLEANNRIGGLTDTYEINGIKLSRASYVLGLMPKFLIEKFEIPTIKIDPVEVFCIKNKVIPLWRDEKKRQEEMIKAGEVKYPELERKIFGFKKLLYEKFTFVLKPPTKDEVLEEAKKQGYEEFLTSSCYKLLSEYLSEELIDYFIYPSIKYSLAYVLAYLFTYEWSLVPGGMGTLAKTIYNKALNLGVNFLLNHKVEELVIRDNKIKYVVANGKKFEADIVVSAISPLYLFKLLGIDVKNLGFAKWRKYNLILKEYPKFPENLKSYAHSIITTEHCELIFPSILDLSRNGITLEVMGSLNGLFQDFPDLNKKIVYIDELNSEKASVLYNIPNGFLDHVPMREPYLFDQRPSKEHNYATLIQNLFQCSVGTYPGGQVTGIQGYNVANLIIKTFKKG